MPRTARKASESGFYHVMARGASRQLIFEDDTDRQAFLSLLSTGCRESGIGLLAYVLMDNHVHLLVEGSLENLSVCMKKVTGTYASQFNRRHARCGHLFQDRYRSEPIDDEGYLLATVRYIHRNPEAAGLAKMEEWRWSSYREYVDHASLIDPTLVLDILGGVSGFVDFHEKPHEGKHPIECDERRPTRCFTDEEAIGIACGLLEPLSLESLSSLPKRERDHAVGRLRGRGLGVRQIQRLTGISLGAISKADPLP